MMVMEESRREVSSLKGVIESIQIYYESSTIQRINFRLIL
jgi:hypothetical protein